MTLNAVNMRKAAVLDAACPLRHRAFLPALSRPAVRSIVLRAQNDEGPIEQATRIVEDKTQDFVKATQENSGLNMGNLGEQPGNNPKVVAGKETAELLSFRSELGPELINGRAAMLGMLAAFGAEVATREPLFVQIQKAPLAIAATFALIIVATLIPIFRNVDPKTTGAGPFTPKAEIYNGRLAMVAFAFLVLVETWKAGPGLVP